MAEQITKKQNAEEPGDGNNIEGSRPATADAAYVADVNLASAGQEPGEVLKEIADGSVRQERPTDILADVPTTPAQKEMAAKATDRLQQALTEPPTNDELRRRIEINFPRPYGRGIDLFKPYTGLP